MNVPVSSHVLIIGIGNPLRSDDGLGWAVARQLAQDSAIDGEIRTVHQLTPELAQHMAAARLVVMIDASREGGPGEVRMREVSNQGDHKGPPLHWTNEPAKRPRSSVGADPCGRPGPFGHHATPEELAALTAIVYGRCPPLLIVTMTGANFDIGERLSPIVARKLSLVSEAVRQAVYLAP